MNEIIASNIQQHRTRKSWTQQQLAEAADIDVRTVQRAEAGNGVAAESIQAMAGALNIAVEDLRETAVDPVFDAGAEQLVRLDPVRRASFVGEALRRTQRTQFVLPGWLAGAELELAKRIVMNFEPLTLGFACASPEDQAEAVLELQADLDDLKNAGLVLAIGYAEVVVLQALPIAPRRTPTLVLSFTRPGAPAPAVVVPLVCEWSGKAVRP